jgi:hypothetical protein
MLSQFQDVFDVDAEISDGVFDLGVARQDLDRPEIASRRVDHRRPCPTQGVGAIVLRPQTGCRDPIINKPRILPGAQVTCRINAAWEGLAVNSPTPSFQSGEQARPHIRCDLELYRATSFLLNTHA